MSKEKTEKAQPTKTQVFSKSAFLIAAETTNDRVLLDVLLEEDRKYSKVEVADLVKTWKQKPATEKPEAEKGADA